MRGNIFEVLDTYIGSITTVGILIRDGKHVYPYMLVLHLWMMMKVVLYGKQNFSNFRRSHTVKRRRGILSTFYFKKNYVFSFFGDNIDFSQPSSKISFEYLISFFLEIGNRLFFIKRSGVELRIAQEMISGTIINPSLVEAAFPKNFC